MIWDAGRQPPTLRGDIWEHWLIAESFDRHGTPDLRPGDAEAVYVQAERFGFQPPAQPYAYAAAPDGRFYGVHFWAYAACAAPAKAYLRWVGSSELAWTGVANAGWFLMAVGVVLFGSSAPLRERFALVALAASGPAWKYINWPGSELFSWTFALIAVSSYRDRRYGRAGAAAGVAALQNPPIILLGGVAVLASLLDRRLQAAVAASIGTAIGLIPYAFFQYHFGRPNLIAAEFASLNNITWIRGWSQAADLSQGMLPYAPVLLVAGVVGAIRLLEFREPRGLLLVAGTVAVAAGTQVAHNWNSSCDGLQRYLVWMIPLVAGIAVSGIATLGSSRRWLWLLGAAALIVQSALIGIYAKYKVEEGYLEHTRIARWVLEHCPAAYWAEHEVFVERTRHADNWPFSPSPFPVAYVREDGTVSKMLLNAASIENVAVRFQVDPAYLAELKREADGRGGLFYVHPPRGTVRDRQDSLAKP
jgi:hypothetical protein